ILVALILRVVAIEWRSKIDDPVWRRRADLGIGIGSWVPAVLWGVAFANIVRGVASNEAKTVTTGFFGLLSPYALLGGAAFGLVFLLHGAVFLALKTGAEVRGDAVRLAAILAPIATVVAGGFALWPQLAYGQTWTWAVVAVAAAALLGAIWLTARAWEGWAFTLTTVAIMATGVLLFGSLFPNVMPSTLDPASSLTIDNASSSPYTLKVMTWAAGLLAPVVLMYQGWTYWVFRQRITMEHIPPSIGLPRRAPPRCPRRSRPRRPGPASRRYRAATVLAGAVTAVTVLISATLIGTVLAGVITDADKRTVGAWSGHLIGLAAVIAVRVAATWVQARYGHRSGLQVVA